MVLKCSAAVFGVGGDYARCDVAPGEERVRDIENLKDRVRGVLMIEFVT